MLWGAKQFVGKMSAKMEDRYATVRRALAGLGKGA